LLAIVAVPPFFAPPIASPQSFKSAIGKYFTWHSRYQAAAQIIEIPHDLVVGRRRGPGVRNGLSTLIIRVKRRLSILRHRPAVSFWCEASASASPDKKDEANA
jgi:hypothetical protein